MTRFIFLLFIADGLRILCRVARFRDQPHDTVTAAQLRRLGFYIQENIPDDSYVRRSSVALDPCEIFDDGTSTLGLVLLEPFRSR